MLTHAALPARGRASDESGFTLIEMLVAMLTGFIVVGALFAILIVAGHQSARISEVAEANKQGRTTMTHIVDELHSACLSQGFAPIQAESTPSKLVLIDGYSEKAEVPSVGTASEGVRKDEIVWSSTAKTLVDNTYLSTGVNSAGAYVFSSTKTPSAGLQIGEQISQTEGKVPVFQYFAYATKANTNTGAVSSALNEASPVTSTPSGSAIGATLAKTVASVLVTFNNTPRVGKSSRSVDFDSQVTLAFSAPDSESTLVAGPCE